MPAHRTPLPRLALPIAAICLGVYLLVGCIPLPGNYQRTTSGERPEKKIGKNGDSDRPLRLGRSSREDVVRVLGTPSYGRDDGRAVAYMYLIRTGVVLWPLCFMAQDVTSHRFLVLRYDEVGVLTSFGVYKRLEDSPDGIRPTFRPGEGRLR